MNWSGSGECSAEWYAAERCALEMQFPRKACKPQPGISASERAPLSGFRLASPAQGGSFWGTVFIVFSLLLFFDRLFRRNNPLKSVVLSQRSQDKRRVAGDERQSGAEKIGGIRSGGLLRLAVLDKFEDFGETR